MSRLDKSLDSAGRWISRLQIGCVTILANLFFAGFCLWGAYAGYTSWQLETQGETTTGTVVRLEESSTSEGGCCVYSPVVEFQAAGQAYTFDGSNASDPPAYKIGQQVRVRYDPARPSIAQIDSFFERWLFPIMIIPAMLFAALLLNFFMFRAFLRGDDLEH
jgi:hypothetical protein